MRIARCGCGLAIATLIYLGLHAALGQVSPGIQIVGGSGKLFWCWMQSTLPAWLPGRRRCIFDQLEHR